MPENECIIGWLLDNQSKEHTFHEVVIRRVPINVASSGEVILVASEGDSAAGPKHTWCRDTVNLWQEWDGQHGVGPTFEINNWSDWEEHVEALHE